jgi:hypothetical protein
MRERGKERSVVQEAARGLEVVGDVGSWGSCGAGGLEEEEETDSWGPPVSERKEKRGVPVRLV